MANVATTEVAKQLTEQLSELLGVDRVSAAPRHRIRGHRAILEVRPADVEQVSAVLAWANKQRLAVCVAGGATKLAWGERPDRFDLLLRTTDLSGRCDIDADDLTATVSAGVTIAETRARARADGRVFPIDAGQPAFATVGGVAATGDQGARGAGYGRVRDLALGLKAVLADGTQVRFGGRTMKNVAGYDMTKLFVGSFGVLGVVTEVTFRLLPQPESQGLLVIPLDSLAHAQKTAATVLDSSLQPLVLEVVAPRTDDAVLLAGFGGHPAAVERSLRDVREWAGGDNSRTLRDQEADSLLDALAGSGRPTASDADEASATPAVLKTRIMVPLSSVWEVASRATDLAELHGLRLGYRIGAGRGQLDLTLRPPAAEEGQPVDATDAMTAWATGARSAAVAAGGQLVVTAGIESLLGPFDTWGKPGSSLRLMKAIKKRLDPERTLNPGRFVGAI